MTMITITIVLADKALTGGIGEERARNVIAGVSTWIDLLVCLVLHTCPRASYSKILTCKSLPSDRDAIDV
jgi:hypothetical protein